MLVGLEEKIVERNAHKEVNGNICIKYESKHNTAPAGNQEAQRLVVACFFMSFGLNNRLEGSRVRGSADEEPLAGLN